MTPLILGALWVVAASITAMLPMRAQMIPGLSLLLAAPLLLIWIYRTQGVFWTAAGTFALLSMFRRPLTYFARKALRLPLPDLPAELGRELLPELQNKLQSRPHTPNPTA